MSFQNFLKTLSKFLKTLSKFHKSSNMCLKVFLKIAHLVYTSLKTFLNLILNIKIFIIYESYNIYSIL